MSELIQPKVLILDLFVIPLIPICVLTVVRIHRGRIHSRRGPWCISVVTSMVRYTFCILKRP